MPKKIDQKKLRNMLIGLRIAAIMAVTVALLAFQTPQPDSLGSGVAFMFVIALIVTMFMDGHIVKLAKKLVV